MKFGIDTPQGLGPCSHFVGLRWLVSGMLCLSLLLVQVLPMSAAQNTMIWVEICGAHGAETIQIEADYFNSESDPESDPNPACAHCSYCLVETAGVSGVLPAFKSEAPKLILAQSISSHPQVSLVNDPEHYWSQSRGPPNGNGYNTMILCDDVKTTYDPVMPNVRLEAS